MMTNKWNTTLYVGITNNLVRRVHEHRTKALPGFTRLYNLSKIVWFETAENPLAAIEREKQLKAGSRRNKIVLVDAMDPGWEDLTESILG